MGYNILVPGGHFKQFTRMHVLGDGVSGIKIFTTNKQIPTRKDGCLLGENLIIIGGITIITNLEHLTTLLPNFAS